jgi:sec-independent protein translocase protein TatC
MSGRSAASPDDGRMTLLEHVLELRARLAKALLGLAAVTIVCFIFFGPIFSVLTQPYCGLPIAHRLGGGSCNLVVLGVFDSFVIRLKTSLIAGAIGSSPIWLYQLWAFITPGLYRNERRMAIAFVASSVTLFAGGCVIAYYSLPTALDFLLGFAHGGITPLLEVTRYLSFVVSILLIFGVSFEFPLLVVMLNVAGVISSAKLRQVRRIVVFGLFAFAAVATPTQDPFTMLGLAVPLVLLYEVAILVARSNDRRRARLAAASPYAGLDPDQPSSLPETLPEPPRPDYLVDDTT